LPVIGAAQERATRGKQAQPRIIRPFVTLLAARPRESGATALILARFYLCHLLPPYCAAHLARNPLPSSELYLAFNRSPLFSSTSALL